MAGSSKNGAPARGRYYAESGDMGDIYSSYGRLARTIPGV